MPDFELEWLVSNLADLPDLILQKWQIVPSTEKEIAAARNYRYHYRAAALYLACLLDQVNPIASQTRNRLTRYIYWLEDGTILDLKAGMRLAFKDWHRMELPAEIEQSCLESPTGSKNYRDWYLDPDCYLERYRSKHSIKLDEDFYQNWSEGRQVLRLRNYILSFRSPYLVDDANGKCYSFCPELILQAELDLAILKLAEAIWNYQPQNSEEVESASHYALLVKYDRLSKTFERLFLKTLPIPRKSQYRKQQAAFWTALDPTIVDLKSVAAKRRQSKKIGWYSLFREQAVELAQKHPTFKRGPYQTFIKAQQHYNERLRRSTDLTIPEL